MNQQKKYQNNIFDFRKKEILNLFKYLNNKKNFYSVLGNLTNFPNKIKSDIDIYLNFKNSSELKILIKDFAKKRNLQIVNILQHEYNSFYFVLTKKINNDLFNITLDFCNYYTYNGMNLINFSNLKKIKVRSNNVFYFRLNNRDNFYYYFIKKILKGDINNESFKYLKKNKYFIINSNFFNYSEKKVILNILKSKKFFLFLNKTKYLRKIITSNKNISFLNEIKRIFFRIKYQTGFHIAFLGVDGSGKSLQIDYLKNSIFRLFFRKTIIYHLFNLQTKQNKKKVIPYLKSYGYFFSFLKILFLFFKFLRFYYVKIFLLKVKSTLIINDRSHLDVIIDPHRYGIFFHISFLKLLFKIFPKPDLTIYLDAKSDTILKRSNEIPKILVEKNLIKYQNNLKNKKNIFFINSNHNLSKIKNDISKILLKYLINKSNFTLKKIK